mgnify:CR=1 FL=1
MAGGANLGELSDLMYFIKKLYRALKVPSARLDPQDNVEASGTSILMILFNEHLFIITFDFYPLFEKVFFFLLKMCPKLVGS